MKLSTFVVILSFYFIFCKPVQSTPVVEQLTVEPENYTGSNSSKPRFLTSAIGNLLLAPFGDFFPIEIDVPGTAGSLYNSFTGYFTNLFTGFLGQSQSPNKKKKMKRPHKKYANPR